MAVLAKTIDSKLLPPLATACNTSVSKLNMHVQVVLELAEQINGRPLPPVSQRAGLLVPQDEDALLAQNMRLRVQDARLSDADVSIRPPAGAASLTHI